MSINTWFCQQTPLCPNYYAHSLAKSTTVYLTFEINFPQMKSHDLLPEIISR